MKTCTKCHQSFEASEFYRGHAQCKACVRARVRSHRAIHVDRIRAYDRERAKQPHVKARIARISQQWRDEHPASRAAQVAVGNALRDGFLVRPKKCGRCRLACRVQAHHWDYSKPLVVEWLCKPCHAKADQERRQVA